MKNKKYVLVYLLISYPVVAFAYIDPGTGTLLIQGLLALFGAIIVFVKSPGVYIKRLYRGIKNRITGVGDPGTDSHDDA